MCPILNVKKLCVSRNIKICRINITSLTTKTSSQMPVANVISSHFAVLCVLLFDEINVVCHPLEATTSSYGVTGVC